MISFEQAQAGLIRYIDTEIMPRVQVGGLGRLALATYLGLSSDGIVSTLNKYKDHPLVEMTNVIKDDHIDIERLYGMVAQNFTDPVCFDIPLVGIKMKFSRADLDQLYAYMR